MKTKLKFTTIAFILLILFALVLIFFTLSLASGENSRSTVLGSSSDESVDQKVAQVGMDVIGVTAHITSDIYQKLNSENMISNNQKKDHDQEFLASLDHTLPKKNPFGGDYIFAQIQNRPTLLIKNVDHSGCVRMMEIFDPSAKSLGIIQVNQTPTIVSRSSSDPGVSAEKTCADVNAIYVSLMPTPLSNFMQKSDSPALNSARDSKH